MLIDEVEIRVLSGHGGKGAVAFDTSKGGRGTSGGNGGAGGSVYIEGVSNLAALKRFRDQKEFSAKAGVAGAANNQTGKNGEDLTLLVPVGTVIEKLADLEPEAEKRSEVWLRSGRFEVLKVGEKILVAQGGKGGKGNTWFKSSRRTSPKFAQPGLPGEAFRLRLELQLIADVGLIGLPNAGKSSLLNAVTRATARVASHPFTTLEPNLGVLNAEVGQRPLVLADIPGLIEGASLGKGLGIKFLRHINRTNTLLHCISLESSDVERDYKIIRQELGAYSSELAQKPEYIILTKTDLVSDATVVQVKKSLEKFKREIISVSVQAEKGLHEFISLLHRLSQ